MNSLQEIAQLVRNCTDCALCHSRTQGVPGEGPDDARLLFIGEGPGYHEDRQGRPFVGPAGQFLDELLTSIGLNRENVFIANMVKCRPPDNRDPLPSEITACNKYLDGQIELINPDLVVTLGRFSLAKFFPKETISRARGKARNVGGLTVFPIMHPAAALHRRELRKVIQEDFKSIPALLRRAATNRRGAEAQVLPQQPKQLSMFE